jgi:hypothetical protein
MLDEVLRSYGMTLDYLRRLVADLDDRQMALQPGGAVNHPAWVLGHLAFSFQGLGRELGLAPWLPDVWKSFFGTDSKPKSEPGVYPAKATLLDHLFEGRRRLAAALTERGDEGLAGPLPDTRFRSVFPTLGHAVVHILVAHTAMHVGQLIVWRKVMGLPPHGEAFV